MERAGFGTFSASRSASSAATYFLELSLIATSYIGLAESARLLPAMNPAATPWWPPIGFALALVLLGGYRIWPAILVGSVFYIKAGRSLPEFGSVGIGTLLAAFAGAWLIGRWSNGRQTFDTPSGVAKVCNHLLCADHDDRFDHRPGRIHSRQQAEFLRFCRHLVNLVAFRRGWGVTDYSPHKGL